MPAKATDLERVARKLGITKARHKRSHARSRHADGRATTIPIHPSAEVGGWLFHEILGQMGITEEEYRRLA
jgi:predicted RNA binding protein YcfA (HicA-like mRNA interferase family)